MEGSSEKPLCYCGQNAILKPAWTRANPGRRFYGCMKHRGSSRGCGYFEWFDDTLTNHYRDVAWGLLSNIKRMDVEQEMMRRNAWKKLVFGFAIGLLCGMLITWMMK